jgi:aldehyde dehydrogenase (NAD+)
MYTFDSFINGEWRSEGGAEFTTFNPSSPDERVGRYTATSEALLGEALSSAGAAQAAWQVMPPAERGRLVGAYLDAIAARTEEIANAVTLEQGKPLGESVGESGKALREARYMAGEAVRSHSGVVPAQKPDCRNLVFRRPRGVIAAVTPWNFPVLTPLRKIAPALAHGNAIILKPSELTPASSCLIAEAAEGILPPGLLQIVHGGGEVGAALVRHPRIDGVTFTGSVETGRRIFAAAAENLAELSLELGGKNAAVINDTDDLDRCLDQVFGAACQCAGQRCTAISRVIVAEDLYETVLAGLKARAEAQVIGDGMDQATTLGPLVNAGQLDRVSGFVTRAIEEGAEVVTGGAPADVPQSPTGYFYQPTVLSSVTPSMEVARAEVFGPVLSVLTYQDFDEAIERLNDVEFGLTSSLFSNDSRLIQRFLDESQNGMLHVNHGTIPDDHMPFGGIRNSGVGAYSVGPSAVNFYTTEHSAYLQYPKGTQ